MPEERIIDRAKREWDHPIYRPEHRPEPRPSPRPPQPPDQQPGYAQIPLYIEAPGSYPPRPDPHDPEGTPDDPQRGVLIIDFC